MIFCWNLNIVIFGPCDHQAQSLKSSPVIKGIEAAVGERQQTDEGEQDKTEQQHSIERKQTEQETNSS